MKHNPWKWLVLGGALTFLVLFGMEMSTSGIERIYGPIEDGEEYVIESGDLVYRSETEKKIEELERELDEIRKLAYGDESDHPRLPGLPYEAEQPAVNRLADSTSGLLQSASNKGIRFIVSMFDGWMN